MSSASPGSDQTLREQQRANWDRAAPGWGVYEDKSDDHANLTARLLSLAGIQAGHHVLDLACGTGDPSFAIAARVGATGSVLGLDLSSAMAERAGQLAQERGIVN